METNTPIDIARREQMDQRREKALAAIARTRTGSILTLQVPVWFALVCALLIAFSPLAKPNPIPYVASMLAFAIAFSAAIAVRVQRRLEAVVRLVTQDLHAD